MKKICFGSIFAIITLFIVLTMPSFEAKAEDVTFSVMVRPSFTMSLSSNTVDLDISDSNPQGPFRNAALNVYASTNSSAGYQLFLSAPSTSLVRTAALSDGTRPSIPTLDGTYYSSNFPAGYWGISNDNYTYRPFETNSVIASSYEATSQWTYLHFAVKGSPSIEIGTYELALNFAGTANIVELILQEQTDESMASALPEVGSVELFEDSRDGEIYPVGKLLDGNYWMLENLRLGAYRRELTLTPEDTNIAGNFTLNSYGRYYTYGDEWSSWEEHEGTYSEPDAIPVYARESLSYGSGTSRRGAYYNYCAATAGEICAYDDVMNSSSEFTDVYYLAHDICPRGWHMPSFEETNNLLSAYRSRYDDSSYLENLKIDLRFVMAGISDYDDYHGSYIYTGDYGTFWSSTYYSGFGVKSLFIYRWDNYAYDGSNTNDWGAGRFNGPSSYASIRCVFGEPEYSDTEIVYDEPSGVDPCAMDGCWDPCDEDPDNC